MSRPRRTITDKEKEELLALPPDPKVINKTLLDSLFTERYDVKEKKIVPSRFNTYDTFTLKKGESFNDKDVLVNVGLFIFNKYLIEKNLSEVVGYVDYEVDSKKLNGIIDKVSSALLMDKITEDVFIEFMDNLCELAFSMNTEICSSMTLKSIEPLPKVIKRKEELLKKYEKEIAAADLPTTLAIEKELVALSRQELGDDPSLELYDSGARGSFDGGYKNSMIMQGAMFNTAKGEWQILTKSLNEGIAKEEIPILANSVVAGSYPKAISTGECGYLTKQLGAGNQNIVQDYTKDCGTKGTMEVDLTEDNYKYFELQYMMEGDKPVLLTPDNKSQKIGKKVKFRMPSYCTGDQICNICGGAKYKALGIQTIGTTTGRISNSMLNARMKAFHTSAVKVHVLDPESIFI